MDHSTDGNVNGPWTNRSSMPCQSRIRYFYFTVTFLLGSSIVLRIMVIYQCVLSMIELFFDQLLLSGYYLESLGTLYFIYRFSRQEFEKPESIRNTIFK